MNDKIIVSDLQAAFCVGVPDSERARPQRLLICLELECDLAEAAAADDLTRTVDYDALSRRIQAWGAGRSWKLIERLAVDLANLILDEYHPRQVKVRVKKFVLAEARFVAVEVVRGQPN